MPTSPETSMNVEHPNTFPQKVFISYFIGLSFRVIHDSTQVQFEHKIILTSL